MHDSPADEALDGLPPSAKFVYYVLSQNGETTLKGLTEETRLGSRTARYGLTQLEEAGLVTTAPALHDGRQTCYSVDTRAFDGDRLGHSERALVSPDALERALPEYETDDPGHRLVEVSSTYADGHLPGAVELDPRTALFDAETRTVPERERLERLLGERGVTADSTVVLYGDGNNEFAAFVYWILTYYHHRDVRLLDGGKRYWFEHDYPTTTDRPDVTPTTYEAQPPNERVRAHRDEVLAALSTDAALVDVRSPAEYRGEADVPARAKGHIPGTANVEWTSVLRDDGRFEPPQRLERPFAEAGVDGEAPVIVYCNVGERSALVWFALAELLDYDEVANYDGSWTEWGNLVDTPIETGQVEDGE